ncbi:Ribonuclease 3 [Chlamydiales bacterium STE3]|nr:Ribonuclease 3 [Chlamydiales bacterium STE3]
MDDLLKKTSKIEDKLGYVFKDKHLLALAFIHRSYINENKHVTQHNERLEFLGDSVLGLLIADYLYQQLPNTPEGDLSYLRSRLVEAASCVLYVTKLNVDGFLLLGKGERMNDGRGRESILADLFEAIIGAIYLDGGLEASRAFIFNNFFPEIDSILKTPLRNWKALLQDYCQKKHQQPPDYKILDETGPDHSKIFLVAVALNEEVLGQGHGSSKKEAQQAAAQDALKKLNFPNLLI